MAEINYDFWEQGEQSQAGIIASTSSLRYTSSRSEHMQESFVSCLLMYGASNIIDIIVIHLKYFAVSDWLKLSPRLILHNQSALAKFGRWEQYTIDSTIHLPGKKAAWVIDCWSTLLASAAAFLFINVWTKKMAFTAIQRRKSWSST